MDAQHLVEERLIELELRYTQQHELTLQLSDVVAAQQKEIGQLAGELRRLREQFSSEPWREDGPGGGPSDETPPHY
jgi:uncharacterized coiled-coil protein SlyX